jgi:epoxyqueuosine reductase
MASSSSSCAPVPILSAAEVRSRASAVGFPLVGLAPAAAVDGGPLRAWLAAGHDAGMSWMRRRIEERLDPRQVLAGARSVIALGIPYRRPSDERSRVASYARGRDYHYAHRDRMKTLRKRLLELDPSLETYACVDTGVAMEKVWAERAGLGWIGKNGLLISPRFGSWVTLSVMFLDRVVDVYDTPHDNRCGDCVRCLGACPTGAFAAPGVVDARRCVAYHSIENRGLVPTPLRRGFAGRLFGCDVCQDVCPYNHPDIPVGDARFQPRPLGALSPLEAAALTEAEFAEAAAGMAVARVGYDGFRRNALYALGMARTEAARPVIERLCEDASEVVADAARWALERMR